MLNHTTKPTKTICFGKTTCIEEVIIVTIIIIITASKIAKSMVHIRVHILFIYIEEVVQDAVQNPFKKDLAYTGLSTDLKGCWLRCCDYYNTSSSCLSNGFYFRRYAGY